MSMFEIQTMERQDCVEPKAFIIFYRERACYAQRLEVFHLFFIRPISLWMTYLLMHCQRAAISTQVRLIHWKTVFLICS